MDTAMDMKRTMLQKLWSFSIFAYIVCMTAFTGTESTTILNKVSLYFFLFVSAANILALGKVKWNFFIVSIFLYLAVLIIGYFYTPSPKEGYEALYDFITVCIICLFTVNFVDSEERVYLILDAFIIGGLILCIYGFSIYGTSVFEKIINSNNIVRVGNELGNANAVGMSYAYAVLFSLFMLINRKNRHWKSVIYVLTIGVCSVFALLTGSKKAFLLLLCGVVIVFFLKKENRNAFFKKTLLAILGIGILLVIVYAIKNFEMFRAISLRFDELIALLTSGAGNESDNARVSLIEGGLAVFSSYPLLGAGTAASYYYFGVYAHNNYVEILMNTGIIGFLIFYSSYAVVLFRLLKSDSRKSALNVCGILIIVMHLILGFALVYYFDRYDQIMIAMVSVFASFKLKAEESV